MTRTLTIATFVALICISPATAAEQPKEVSLTPPVYLPDGSEFKTWERPPTFSRTIYVDQNHTEASDDNPGAQDRPLKTVNRAAQLAQPGDRVLVAAGVYRERIAPARGGTGPERMISYEAAPGAEVVLKGSRVLEAEWIAADKTPRTPRVWIVGLPEALFDEGNPFAKRNLTDERIDECMPWAVGMKGKVPNTLRRGLVFQDGRRLAQVASRDDVVKSPGSYWVGENGLDLVVRPFDDAEPKACTWEVTTRETIFAPKAYGLGYIRVKGFTVEHCANAFPRPQLGAISTQRGHHWIIEENTVRQCNSLGVDIGDQFDTTGPKLAQGGRHIVRRNTISECGVGGIEGKRIEYTLIEDNILRRCGWQRVRRISEVAAVKVHRARCCLLRRNLVADTIAAPGIWMDYGNVNSRCSGNVVIGADCINGGIFMEASQEPNLVDSNIVWASRAGGIYQHDCDELIITNNLVGCCAAAPVRMRVTKGREVLGRPVTAKRNKIVGNIFVANGRPPSISDPDNTCDYNVYATGDGAPDLAAWRRAHGWGEHSVVLPIQAKLDLKSLTLSWTIEKPMPACPAVSGVTYDFFGEPRDAERTIAGPILKLAKSGRFSVDPVRLKD